MAIKKEEFYFIAYFGLLVGCFFFVRGTISDYKNGQTLFQTTTKSANDSENPTLVLCFPNEGQTWEDFGAAGLNFTYNYRHIDLAMSNQSVLGMEDLKLKEGNNFIRGRNVSVRTISFRQFL